MGKVVALLLVLGLAAVAVAAYDFFVFEVVQPVPLSWTHSEDEPASSSWSASGGGSRPGWARASG